MAEEPSSTPGTVDEVSSGIASGKVLVTGGSGFVGRHIVRELVARGYEPACLVRNPERFASELPPEIKARVRTVQGDIFDSDLLATAGRGCAAAIHLIGIIEERKLAGRTFQKLHVDATRTVVSACKSAGIPRYIHMSALGTRPNAPSAYHRTKWAAENIVRESSLAWTIFRPSLIHGPDGEFMQMMKFFSTSLLRQPVMPYFGNGNSLIQPVSVRDVASVFVSALRRPETVGQVYELGGPEQITWKELYDICAQAITGRKRLKISVPVSIAKLAARIVMPITPRLLVPYKFNVAQVQMSQENSVCHTAPVEQTFGIKLRNFREELAAYADLI